MSKYTTEIRFICESLNDLEESKGFNDIDNIIANARPKIFDFAYPIFDENFKSVLETQILKHYYTREICEETFGLWKLRLSQKLNDIMPYYNQLYDTTLMEINPLYTTDIRRKTDRIVDQNGKMKDLYSDTPQGSIENLEAETYLTNARFDSNEAKSVDDYLEIIQGRVGTNGSTLLKEYRKTLLNINMMIIEDMQDLFFNLWN